MKIDGIEWILADALIAIHPDGTRIVYPLNDKYASPIIAFFQELEKTKSLLTKANRRGDYDSK